MPIVLVTFQIPLTEDEIIGNGKLHPPYRWKVLQKAIYELFGGWTINPGTVQGVWKDPKTGKQVRDRSRVYQVDVEDKKLDELRTLLRRACLTFGQQTIRAVIDGRPEYQSPGEDDEPL